ncbi:MAG: hypothetical protein AAGH74_00880 [Pseudomonadota bacterium]
MRIRDFGVKQLLSATTTPLASIFGSGFLVIVPILAGAVGPYSVLAMAGVCALAFAMGSVIRFNIRHAEPVLAADPSEMTLSFERASDLALVIAYIISVCLYIHILAAFVLTGLGTMTPLHDDLLTTAVIAAITLVGVINGLDGLSFLERWALLVTFAIITLLLGSFAVYDLGLASAATGIQLPKLPEQSGWTMLTLVAGTLIVVQGFETPRYLGATFDAETRVKASRLSQLISSAVYITFVALALPMVVTLGGNYDDDSLIALAKTAAIWLPIPLIIAAALSQFAAAVADTLAASGNLAETTHDHLKVRYAYVIVGAGAIALTWTADTLEILALASRAFAFYYFLQCLVAMSVAQSMHQRLLIAPIAMAMAFVTVFAVPAG